VARERGKKTASTSLSSDLIVGHSRRAIAGASSNAGMWPTEERDSDFTPGASCHVQAQKGGKERPANQNSSSLGVIAKEKGLPDPMRSFISFTELFRPNQKGSSSSSLPLLSG